MAERKSSRRPSRERSETPSDRPETPSELYQRRRARRPSKDSSFESKAQKATRWKELQSNPIVESALDDWWVATDSDGNGVIDKSEYLELGKALYRLMIGDGEEAAALASAESDWLNDCQGHDVLDRALFKQAIFELYAPLS
jgi:hypothetical protein